MNKLFLLFLLLPLIEIYFLIEIGSVFGAWLTIFVVLLTAIIGAWLVRFQGVSTFMRAQREMLNQRMPAMEVIEGALLLLAGVFLVIPGFFTDALGFLLLVQPLRQFLVRRFLKKRVVPTYDGSFPHQPTDKPKPRIIDSEYKEIDE